MILSKLIKLNKALLSSSKIHDEREYSVSGIARFNNGYLVVHDNKRKNQARVSHINDELKITKLIWPETLLPFDLEAIAALPNKSNHFILMESTGKCYEIISPLQQLH